MQLRHLLRASPRSRFLSVKAQQQRTKMVAKETPPHVFSMGPGTLQIDRKTFHGATRADVLRRLREALPDEAARGVLLLQGGKTLPVDATDGEILFRQEAFFHHLFGANEDGLYGTLDVRSGESAVFVPRLPAEYGVWMGKLQPPSYYQAKYGVDAAHYVDELPEVLKASNARVLHVLSGVNSDSGLELPRPVFDGDAEFEFEAGAALPALQEARAHKTRGELDAIAYVNRLGSEAHVLMMLAAAKAGAMEYQLESIFRHHTYSVGGCRNQGYTPIVASGPNGAVLHYGHAGAPNDRQLRDGDMMLLDCGCEYYRFTSDITTAFPVGGKFRPDQRLVYEAVLDAHNSVLSALKPGVSWPDMHTLAYAKVLSALKEGGLVKGDVGEMIDADVGAVFMPHGLGHLLGIDTHDVGGYGAGFPPRSTRPGYKSLRTARALEEGMVVTVEPGCYFNEDSIKAALEDPARAKFLVAAAIEPFYSFGGVRLEDNVLITATGSHSFTHVPRSVGDIEAVMAGQLEWKVEDRSLGAAA